MKLLSKIAPSIDKDGIAIKMRRVTKMMQANLIDLSVKATDLIRKMELIDYVCMNCIETIAIDGESYDPAELSEQADISDDETLTALMKVAELVIGIAFLKEEEVKK